MRFDAFTEEWGFSKERRVATALFSNDRCERIHRA
jgi:hypothetical protein